MGYIAQPDFGPAHIKEIEKKTADAIDAEGWMHTGDKGTAGTVAHVAPNASHVSPSDHYVPKFSPGIMTDAGMVKITGRLKEPILNSSVASVA